MKCQVEGCSGDGYPGVFQRRGNRGTIIERKATVCRFHAGIPSVWGKFREEES